MNKIVPGGLKINSKLVTCPCGATWRRTILMKYKGDKCPDCRTREDQEMRRRRGSEMPCRYRDLLQKIYDELTIPRGCTCGGTDIGVGIQHEPRCGEPNTDEIARAIKEELDAPVRALSKV